VSGAVLLLVLAAAAMHAGWNASVKSAADPLMRLVLINAGFLVCGAPLIAAVAAPARASWPRFESALPPLARVTRRRNRSLAPLGRSNGR